MSRGTEIIVSANPQGKFEECFISGTPSPGMLMELVVATAPKGGRFTYQACQRGDGVQGAIAVLLGDPLQGKLSVGAMSSFGGAALGDAYVDGTRGFLYWPLAGEELNLAVKDIAGTGDDVARGDSFGVDGTNHGYIKKDSSFGSAPFQSREAITDPTADYLLWVQYKGNQA